MKKEKKIDENIYNERSLYLLNIRELRDLGRKIGVPAPATLKKQDLVDYILKIVYGEVDVPKRNSCGRPNVRDVDINQFLSKIMKKTDINDEILGASFEDYDSLFKVASFEEKPFTKEVEQRIFVEDNKKYYFRKYGFVKSESDIEVAEQIMKKYNLSNFDVVEAIISGKSFKIISVNGKIVEKNNEKSAKNKQLGTKQVFHLSTKEEIKKDIENQIKNSEKNNFKTIIYSQNEYKNKDVIFVKAQTNQTIELAYKNFMKLVNICEKSIYEGEGIVVITDESEFIEKTIDALDEDVSSRTKKHLQEKIDELLALGNVLIIYKLDKNAIYQ